jgi:hypothetical protein
VVVFTVVFQEGLNAEAPDGSPHRARAMAHLIWADEGFQAMCKALSMWR